jgi:hypothetical protein
VKQFYMPVLKFKQAEYMALWELKETEKDLIVPFFELPPITYDFAKSQEPETLEKQVIQNAGYLDKRWAERPAFIDGTLIENKVLAGGRCPLTLFFQSLESSLATQVLPVVSIRNNDAYKKAVKELLDEDYTQSVCIKTYLDDFLESNFADNLNILIAYLDLEPEEMHLVIDLKKPENFSDYQNFANVVLHVMTSIPHYAVWLSITLCGSAFPRSMSEIKAPGQIVTRSEWLLYKQVVSTLEPHHRTFNFGDYGIENTEYTEYQPKFMRASASIKYTIDDGWYITKGTVLKTKVDYRQFLVHSKILVDSDFFCGEAYSAGDKKIAAYAGKDPKGTGNPGVWKRIGFNHHFTKVINDLSATPGASLALV